MAIRSPNPDEREDRLDAIVSAYLQAVEAGEDPRPQELLDREPDLAEELEAFFEAHKRMQTMAEPLKPVAQAAHIDLPDDDFSKLNPNAEGDSATSQACRFGDFELLKKIGEGGMGAVYKARDLRQWNIVALKLLLAGRFARPSDLSRFRNEAEMVTEVDHPNIVPVLDVGEHQGRPFFSMKLMAGSLADRIEHFRDDPRAAVAIVATLARAVHHVHERGILHRDLKPGNVLLDADGRPHLTDFGLGKWLNQTTDLSAPQAIIGTASWMAPEQAGDSRRNVTKAVDVYGLGAVLYGLLTGHPPFRADSLSETLALLREREPDRPGARNPRVDRDLETICLKCLQKDPAGRYASAAELADDLARWLAGEPIRARPVGPIRRLGRWCRRRPWTMAATAAALCLALAGGAIAWTRYEAANLQFRKDVLDAEAISTTLERSFREFAEGHRPEAESARTQARGRRDAASEAVRLRFAGQFADLDMVFRLEDIRLEEREPAPVYLAAFREYGIDVEQSAPADVAAQIEQRAIRPALVAALDEWARRAPDQKARQRLRDIADRADDRRDALPARLRDALGKTTWKARLFALLKLVPEARANPPAPAVVVSLASALRDRGAAELALPSLREGVTRHPGDFWLNLELAAALAVVRPAQTNDSRRYLTAASALSRGNPSIYLYLGNALFDRGAYRQAAAAYQEAIDEATRRKRDYPQAWNNLGNARTKLGDFEGAVKAFDEAIRLRPGFARAYHNRGVAFDEWERFSEAMDSYRAAIRSEPGNAEAYFNLALDLTYREGKFAEALTTLDHGRPHLSAVIGGAENWTALSDEARRLRDLEPRLEQVLKRQGKPKDADEACRLAQLAAWPHHQLYATAARFYERAFELEPRRATDLVRGYRYHAAQCAAQAGGGHGPEAARLDPAERSAMRQQALAWLRADLDLRGGQLKTDKAAAQRAVGFWHADPALAAVRKAEAMAKLPPSERAEWERFWAEVAALGK